MEQASEGEKWKQQEWTRKINSHTLQRGPVLFYQIFIKMILNIKYWGGGEGIKLWSTKKTCQPEQTSADELSM